jgi:hypothetical protein
MLRPLVFAGGRFFSGTESDARGRGETNFGALVSSAHSMMRCGQQTVATPSHLRSAVGIALRERVLYHDTASPSNRVDAAI